MHELRRLCVMTRFFSALCPPLRPCDFRQEDMATSSSPMLSLWGLSWQDIPLLPGKILLRC